MPRSPVDLLRERVQAGDLASADALIARHAPTLDHRRALDLAIRSGQLEAVRHFLPRAGLDAELDPDATTPLIRAVVDAPPAVRPLLVALLVSSGARPDLADRYGRDARTYAGLRNRSELLALMAGPDRPSDGPSMPPAFTTWLGAAEGADRPRAGRIAPLDAALLMRRSPWWPDTARADVERVALRFHVDGTADVLRLGPGGNRPDALSGAFAAWRIDAGELQLAITGEPFSVRCVGRPADGDALALRCEERRPAVARLGGHSLDLARVLLLDDGVPPAPSPVAIAMAPAGPAAAADTVADDRAAPDDTARAWPVRLAGAAPPQACRPGQGRPRAPAPAARTLGDWHVLDIGRFESAAPLSGRLCPQVRARDAALQACRAAAGRRHADCRSVGGCAAGQVSALAGLPGVTAGWIACDADYASARRRALAACRADLGCDCILVGISARNLDTLPTRACLPDRPARAPAPVRERPTGASGSAPPAPPSPAPAPRRPAG